MKQNIANGTAMSRILGLSEPKEGGEQVLSKRQTLKRVQGDVLIGGEVQVNAEEALYISSAIPSRRDTVRRGVSHTPIYDNVVITGGRKHSAPTWTVLILIFICVLFNNAALAQSRDDRGAVAKVVKPLNVGDYVPEDFWDHRAMVYIQGDSLEIQLSQFKGKTLLLDFWATWCGYCIEGFPSLLDLHPQFGQSMNVLLVNSLDTKDTFEKVDGMAQDILRRNHLPSIVGDDYLAKLFPHGPIPHYVWINPKGRVAGITFREFVNTEQVRVFIEANRRYESNN